MYKGVRNKVAFIVFHWADNGLHYWFLPFLVLNCFPARVRVYISVLPYLLTTWSPKSTPWIIVNWAYSRTWRNIPYCSYIYISWAELVSFAWIVYVSSRCISVTIIKIRLGNRISFDLLSGGPNQKKKKNFFCMPTTTISKKNPNDFNRLTLVWTAFVILAKVIKFVP